MNERQIAQFWAYVRRAGPDECWPWIGALDGAGYGVRSFNGKQYRAHRLSYTLLVGSIPEGMFICHRCDVRNCCNPAHLFVGTQMDNIRDMIAKGRAAYGDRHPTRTRPESVQRGDRHWTRRLGSDRLPHGEANKSAKMTEDTVRQMRAERRTGATQRVLAARYKISQATVCDILRRKLWAHVT